MSDRQGGRRGDRILTITFAVIGASGGLFWLLVNSDGPDAPVRASVLIPAPEARRDASLTVAFFGRTAYTRTAPDASAFATEVAFCEWAPPILVVVCGGLGGILIGYVVSRYSHRLHGSRLMTSPLEGEVADRRSAGGG